MHEGHSIAEHVFCYLQRSTLAHNNPSKVAAVCIPNDLHPVMHHMTADGSTMCTVGWSLV